MFWNDDARQRETRRGEKREKKREKQRRRADKRGEDRRRERRNERGVGKGEKRERKEERGGHVSFTSFIPNEKKHLKFMAEALFWLSGRHGEFLFPAATPKRTATRGSHAFKLEPFLN